MKRVEERIGEMVKELPLEFQYEVEDFVRFLLEKRARKPRSKLKFDWEGALEDLRDQYTSVELQRKVLEWSAAASFRQGVCANPTRRCAPGCQVASSPLKMSLRQQS